jgi:hypothetical protein
MPWSLGSDGRLVPSGQETLPDAPMTICSPQTVGLAAGSWCPYGKPGDLALDQRLEEGGSLVFETEPLTEQLEIAGAPMLELTFSSDRPVALAAVRLSDIAPNGAATRVTWGVLNLTHRDSHEHPEPLVPGREYTVHVPLKHIAQRFETGHRVRVAVDTAYFPMVWPSPEHVTLTVRPGRSHLALPVRQSWQKDAELPDFQPAEHAPPLEKEQLTPADFHIGSRIDRTDGSSLTERLEDSGYWRITDIDLTIRGRVTERFRVHPEDPTSASGEVVWDWEMSRGDWKVSTRTETLLTCDSENFRIRARQEAREGDEIADERDWDETIPRNLV